MKLVYMEQLSLYYSFPTEMIDATTSDNYTKFLISLVNFEKQSFRESYLSANYCELKDIMHKLRVIKQSLELLEQDDNQLSERILDNISFITNVIDSSSDAHGYRRFHIITPEIDDCTDSIQEVFNYSDDQQTKINVLRSEAVKYLKSLPDDASEISREKRIFATRIVRITSDESKLPVQKIKSLFFVAKNINRNAVIKENVEKRRDKGFLHLYKRLMETFFCLRLLSRNYRKNYGFFGQSKGKILLNKVSDISSRFEI